MFPKRWFPRFRLILQTLLMCSLTLRGWAQAGALDPGFESALGSGTVKALAVQADGKVIVGGAFATQYSNAFDGVFRLNADGTRDPTFSSDVEVRRFSTTEKTYVNAVALQSDGRILVGGPLLDGGPGGTAFVVVTGEINGGGPVQIVRLLGDGRVDTSFPPVPLPQFTGQYNHPFRRLSVLPDGSLIVSLFRPISVNTSSGALGTSLLRYDAAGALDEPWSRSAAGAGALDFFAVDGEGRALLTQPGSATDSSGNVLRNRFRWLEPSGSTGAIFAEALRTGATGSAAVRSDGMVVVNRDRWFLNTSPPYTAINGTPWTKVAALGEDGSLDPGFGFETTVTDGGSTFVAGSTFRFDESDRLLAGGSFNQFNGVPRRGLARLNADGTTDENFVPDLPLLFSVSTWAFRPDGRIAVGSAPRWIFEGGYFTYARTGGFSSLRADRLAENVSAEIGDIFAMAVQPDGAVIFSGSYQRGDTTHSGLARITSDNRLDAAYAPQIAAKYFQILALPDGKAVVSGAFTAVEGTPRNGLARLHADGSLDRAFDPGKGANAAKTEHGRCSRGFTTAPGRCSAGRDSATDKSD